MTSNVSSYLQITVDVEKYVTLIYYCNEDVYHISSALTTPQCVLQEGKIFYRYHKNHGSWKTCKNMQEQALSDGVINSLTSTIRGK